MLRYLKIQRLFHCTGNLLQAFADFRGKLVSYTTIDGQTKKGILLPEHWNPGEQVADKVTVPIIKALPLIRSTIHGGQFNTDNGLSFFRKGNKFRVIVSGSRQRGGDIFLDKDLLALVDGNNFEKVSNNMSAWLDEGGVSDFVRILGEKHGMSATVNSAQFRQIEGQAAAYTATRRKILPPPLVDEQAERAVHEQATEQQTASNVISLLELEAEALMLELQLLAA